MSRGNEKFNQLNTETAHIVGSLHSSFDAELQDNLGLAHPAVRARVEERMKTLRGKDDYRITAVRRSNGEITEYLLDDKIVVDKPTAMQLAFENRLPGYTIQNSRGGATLKAHNDGVNQNNLTSMKTF